MFFFPFHRPRLGLSIGPRRLSLVDARRDWWGAGRRLRLRQSAERDLPEGLVRLSAAEPNIADPAALTEQVRALLGRRRSRPVALSLPDRCASLGLFELDSIPSKTGELEALVRWRFQQDFNVAAATARLAFQVYRPARSRRQTSRTPVRVLAAAIREDIVTQYEQVCEAAGLLTLRVTLASLSLFACYRPAMIRHARRLARQPGARFGHVLFVRLAEEGFTLIAFHRGSPVLLRAKPPVPSLADELLASLHCYAEAFADPPSEDRPVPWPLFAIEEGARQSGGDPPDPAWARLTEQAVAAGLPVTVVPLGWPQLPLLGRTPAPEAPGALLPALTAVLTR